MGWLIALALVALIGLIPLHLNGSYDENGARLLLYCGPLKFLLYPRDKKEKPEKSSSEETGVRTPKKRSVDDLSDFFSIAKTILAFLGELIHKVKVKYFELIVVLGDDDPCDLGTKYGQVCAAVASLKPVVDKTFRIKKQNVSVKCDYDAQMSTVTACIEISICLARFSILVLRYGFRAIRQYFTIYNKRKGGAKL